MAGEEEPETETGLDGRLVLAAAITFVLTAAILVLLHRVAPDLPAAQRATVKSFDDLATRKNLYRGLLIDVGFIVSYVSFGWALLFLLRPAKSERSDGRSIAAAGCALVLGAGLADRVEDVLLWWAWSTDRATSPGCRRHAGCGRRQMVAPRCRRGGAAPAAAHPAPSRLRAVRR